MEEVVEKVYIERLFDKKIEFYLRSVGAIQVVGPKWCGKSTTSKRHAKTIIDLMKKKVRDQFVPLAEQDPEFLLDYGEKPLLIDEFQIISFIWNSIKEKIDETGKFGQFILTGSVTDASIMNSKYGEENERHTGTGRIIKVMMRTMSLLESGDSDGKVSLAKLKNGEFKCAISEKSLLDYAYLICRGGWPEAINKEEDVALQQAKNFYNGLINEDIFSLKDIPLRKDIERAKKVLTSYSRNISSEASNESLRNDVKENGDIIDDTTFNKYMNVLDRLFVVEELKAWNPNLRSKTTIRSKNVRHFVDPSIATAALGITKNSLMFDLNTFGLLFESLAIRDLRIYAEYLNASIYHYRDKLGREADAVIVFEDGSWGLIEVKLKNTEEIEKSSKKLVELAKDIDNKYNPTPVFLMIITAGNVAYKDENGVYIVPLGNLGI